jgi:hypothetical protein
LSSVTGARTLQPAGWVGSIACGVILLGHSVRRWAACDLGRQAQIGSGGGATVLSDGSPKAALPTAGISGEALRRSWRSTARHEPRVKAARLQRASRP